MLKHVQQDIIRACQNGTGLKRNKDKFFKLLIIGAYNKIVTNSLDFKLF